jgi:hypothetical protein
VGNLDDATKLLNTALKERLGVVVGPLTPKVAAKYGLTSSEGVQIQWVDPKGPFGRVGFEVGDIILAINQQPIQGVDGFDSVMKDAPPTRKQLCRQSITGPVSPPWSRLKFLNLALNLRNNPEMTEPAGMLWNWATMF